MEARIIKTKRSRRVASTGIKTKAIINNEVFIPSSVKPIDRIKSKSKEFKNKFFHKTMKEWIEQTDEIKKWKGVSLRLPKYKEYLAGLVADDMINSMKFLSLEKSNGIFTV